MTRALLSVLLPLALAACMVGPDYHRSTAAVPIAYKELKGWKPSEPSDEIDRGPWWRVYRDPVLSDLESQVDISNQNIKAAEAAYRNSQALIAEAEANLFPVLAVSPSVTRSSSGSGSSGFVTGGTVVGGTGTTSSSTSSSSHRSTSSGSTRTTYSLQGTANWDLDVWGRIRRQIESNEAAAQVSAADIANARLSAQATLASDYFNLRASDELQRLLERTVRAFQRSVDITQNQYNAGVAARSDVITAETQLETTRAQLVNVGVARAQFEHAIAVLIGRPPAELDLASGPLATAVPVVPVSVPSRLLERRPDIAAAERTMQEQNALIGVAVAAFYPDISLSALYGYSGAPPLGSLIAASNRIWSIGASGTETIFEGGLRTAQVAAAHALYDQSVANYRQTVLTAFQQVEDELSTLRVLQEQAVVQTRAVQLAQQAVTIALNEYRAGTVNYITVVTDQATLLGNEQTLVSIQQSRLVASVGLIEALGGGWSTADLPRMRNWDITKVRY
jgi:NodT family efflux transporter outer membrane factor (OMF) lipoprotein